MGGNKFIHVAKHLKSGKVLVAWLVRLLVTLLYSLPTSYLNLIVAPARLAGVYISLLCFKHFDCTNPLKSFPFQLVTRIEMREFYLDVNKQLRPGEKGIVLDVDQWDAVKRGLNYIDRRLEYELRQRNHT